MKELLQEKLIAGTILGDNKYSILKNIGEGAFAFTYQAKAIDLNEIVCLKVLYKAESEEAIERFKQEGKTLSSLSEANPCPYIVKFIELFLHEIKDEREPRQNLEIHVLVMEFVNGTTLSKYISDGNSFSQEDVDLYFEQVATALSWIHEQDIVHRDAHPSNIILQQNESEAILKAVLIDFGLSGNINPEIMTSDHFAHRHFAPPEQNEGIRSFMVDIYTLSASLYYALTKKTPPEAKQRVDLLKKNQGDPLEQHIRALPECQPLKNMRPGIKNVIRKGMSVCPEKRCQSIKDWLEEFKIETQPSIWELIWNNMEKVTRIILSY